MQYSTTTPGGNPTNPKIGPQTQFHIQPFNYMVDTCSGSAYDSTKRLNVVMAKAAAKKLDRIFHALSDGTRRAILTEVSKRERTVGELAKSRPMSLAAVSKHLDVLENAGLIDRKKVGSFRVVSLRAESLKPANEWLSYYNQFWSDKLDALQAFVEKRKK